MKCENELNLRFMSKSCNEGFSRAAVGAFAALMDPTMEELSDIKTAVSEAVTNAIVHGYTNDQGIIEINCQVLEGRVFQIMIRDQGIGIPDIKAARTPLFTTGGSDRSGMGFTIMERFMNSLKVDSQPGEGTTVTMTRKLHGGTFT